MGELRESPEQRRQVARLLVFLSPCIFLFCLVLAQLQGAGWGASLVIAGAGFLMCLGAALLYELRGKQSTSDLFIAGILLRLLGR